MSNYIISKDGKEHGPFSLADVISAITKREFELFDYVYDASKQDWILLTEHPEITGALKAQKPKAPPKSAEVLTKVPEVCPVVEIAKEKINPHVSQADAHRVEWFVMKGQTQFGPFAKGELVRMLQERTVYEFDFVWNASMKDWCRLAQVPEFSVAGIKDLFASKKEAGSFAQRQHPREKLSGPIIVHNNNEFWMAEGKEISVGGLGLYITNSLIVPGQQIHLHVPANNGQEAFNVVGEVVSKKFEPGVQSRNRKIEYGVRFVSAPRSNKVAV